MRTNTRPLAFGLIAALVAVTWVSALFIEPIHWRARVIIEKATGQLPSIDWSDLTWMLAPRPTVFLSNMGNPPNPFAAITNPLSTPEDVAAGKRLFEQHCVVCHGTGGRGGPGGPSLRDRVYVQGRSDWALYRTITHGIPGTAMVGRKLPRNDVWRLVAYLDDLLLKQGSTSNSAAAAIPVVKSASAEDLVEAQDDTSDWLTYSGTYSGERHTQLSLINRDNVRSLHVAWVRQLPSKPPRLESSPIVRSGVMYVTALPAEVYALDAATGRVLWHYSHAISSRLAVCYQANRGVAILGNKLFFATMDAHLIALNAESGALIWDVTVAESGNGYAFTSAPLAVRDMIVIGSSGGDFATRGFIDAYDAATGKRRWRFYTIPAPGSPGNQTWSSGSWRTGGGAPWLTGSFDPALGLLYWGVGNPNPDFYEDGRKGDNLYTDSVVALEAATGKLVWYFQFTPRDTHDWDSAQIPVLIDGVAAYPNRKLMAFSNRNGFYYLLDRTTGEFLAGAPFIRQNWNKGLDARGRPHPLPGSTPTPQGIIIYPQSYGGTSWWSPSYDPNLQLLFVPTVDSASLLTATGTGTPHTGEQRLGSTFGIPAQGGVVAGVEALQVATGRIQWRYVRPWRKDTAETGGLLSTAGGIVFGGDLDVFFALDAATGKHLWQFDAGGQIASAPITYALDGRQYVVVSAGTAVFAFTL